MLLLLLFDGRIGIEEHERLVFDGVDAVTELLSDRRIERERRFGHQSPFGGRNEVIVQVSVVLVGRRRRVARGRREGRLEDGRDGFGCGRVAAAAAVQRHFEPAVNFNRGSISMINFGRFDLHSA